MPDNLVEAATRGLKEAIAVERGDLAPTRVIKRERTKAAGVIAFLLRALPNVPKRISRVPHTENPEGADRRQRPVRFLSQG